MAMMCRCAENIPDPDVRVGQGVLDMGIDQAGNGGVDPLPVL